MLSTTSLSQFGLGLSVLCLTGCLSPEEARRSADEETYALIEARREALSVSDAVDASAFTIEPPQDSLRQRILRGDWDTSAILSLQECLEVAAENNREYQSRKERLYLTALDLTFERWRFRNRPFGGFGLSSTGSAEADQVTADGELGLTRLLGSGASIVTSIGADLFRIVATGDGWDAVGDLGISVTQPLLRGNGQRIVKEPLTQAERSLVYEVRAFERFRRTFAVDVARRVYDLLQSGNELQNEENNYDNLVLLSERNNALAEAGRISQIDSDQARQDELRSEARLISLRANLGRSRDDFNLFLGLPIEFELRLDLTEFESLTDADDLLESIDSQRAIAFALDTRLDYQTTRDTLVDVERRAYIAADALRAGLGLAASVNSVTDEGRPASFRLDDTTWNASLSLDLPLDRKAERNAYRSALINVQATRRSVEQQADTITADVRDALRNANNAQQNYLIQKGAVTLAERRVEGSQLSLDAGRASTRDLLESREALVEVQNAATAALIDFTLARLDLYLQLEVLRVDDKGLRVADELAPSLIPEAL